MTEISESEFQPFWEAAASSELRFPFCQTCQNFHWYPMQRCPHCSGTGISWNAIDPVGIVYSWTVVRRPFDPAFSNQIPYIVALLEFSSAPGVRLITNLTDIEAAKVSFGMIVSPAFDLYDPAERYLTFQPEKTSVEESHDF